jgi:hypothetical protein
VQEPNIRAHPEKNGWIIDRTSGAGSSGLLHKQRVEAGPLSPDILCRKGDVDRDIRRGAAHVDRIGWRKYAKPNIAHPDRRHVA